MSTFPTKVASHIFIVTCTTTTSTLTRTLHVAQLHWRVVWATTRHSTTTTLALVLLLLSTTKTTVEVQGCVSTFSQQNRILQIIRPVQEDLCTHLILEAFQKLKLRGPIVQLCNTKFQLQTPKIIHIFLHTGHLLKSLQLASQFQLTVNITKLCLQCNFQVRVL